MFVDGNFCRGRHRDGEYASEWNELHGLDDKIGGLGAVAIDEIGRISGGREMNILAVSGRERIGLISGDVIMERESLSALVR